MGQSTNYSYDRIIRGARLTTGTWVMSLSGMRSMRQMNELDNIS